MALLCWMAVVLAFFLSADNSVDAVDSSRLATLVNGILREYRTPGMFSLAVSIPEDQNRNIEDILQEVFLSDPGDDVKNNNKNEVYVGSRVVAAKVLERSNRGADHAESRVVDHLSELFKKNNSNDFLLFYVYASPCVEKCSSDTHHESILRRINAIREWKSYAVVFSKIFKPRNGQANTEQELSGALQRLGTYQGTEGQIGLNNIFRCDKRNNWMQCNSCLSGNQVQQYCISDPKIQ
ncbi:uncharacterized protein LOC115010294 [Cottoperca gobio]|uniref:Uncharacterized protein LOC115010294 n=1 Tax=Cottoperca gobio TaxID=56716 RepID=A0A6J2PZE1_COTGO|nr:uncharacterized protein LOC115010294 [Cottoperca gobio]